MQAAATHAAVFVMRDEARVLEHAQMLGNGGQGHAEGPGQLADGTFALRETREDGAACGIGERAKRGIERRLQILNHMV